MTNVIRLQNQQKTQDIPACIDCKWHGDRTPAFIRAVSHISEDHLCKHLLARQSGVHPVTGHWKSRGQSAEIARLHIGHCGPEGEHFEEMHWSQRYRPVIILAVIVLGVLFLTAGTKAQEQTPDSWAAQIELTNDQVFVPGRALTEFEAEFGALMQPREGEVEEGGELDPTGKPVDIIIDNTGDSYEHNR